MSNQTPAFRRILLKLSGEALMGSADYGIDPQVIRRVAEEIREVRELGVQIGVVIGGEARLNLLGPSPPTVRVAGLCAPDLELFPNVESARRALSGGALPADQYASVRERGWAIDGDLLQRSEREARAGPPRVRPPVGGSATRGSRVGAPRFRCPGPSTADTVTLRQRTRRGM